MSNFAKARDISQKRWNTNANRFPPRLCKNTPARYHHWHRDHGCSNTCAIPSSGTMAVTAASVARSSSAKQAHPRPSLPAHRRVWAKSARQCAGHHGPVRLAQSDQTHHQNQSPARCSSVQNLSCPACFGQGQPRSHMQRQIPAVILATLCNAPQQHGRFAGISRDITAQSLSSDGGALFVVGRGDIGGISIGKRHGRRCNCDRNDRF